MSLYDYVEFSENFPLPNCESPSKERFQTHDWNDRLKTIYIDRHGRMWYKEELLRQNNTEDTTKHPDPRLGFNAAAETTVAWKRLDFGGTMEIVGRDVRYNLAVSEGVVQEVQ